MCSGKEVFGKVAIVTGGANGIGAALVAALVKENAKHVVFLDILQDKGIETENELFVKYGSGKVTFIECDVSDEDQLTSAYKRVMDTHKTIDIVYNNAGIFDERKNNFKKMVDVNVTAVINSTLTAMELMRDYYGGRGGTIVNISSSFALMRNHLFPIYGATKSAVLHFSSSMGTEPTYSRTKVRVLTICLCGTATALVHNCATKSWDHRLQDELETLTRTVRLQSTKEAACACLEVLKRGESGSTWLVSDGAAKDISDII